MTNDIKFENSSHYTGYVGKNPEYRTFPSQKRLATFSLALNQPANGRTGQKTVWLEIDAWEEMCDQVQAANFGKGSLVTVYGSLTPNVYDKPVGDRTIEIQKVKIKLKEFQVLTLKSATEPALAQDQAEDDGTGMKPGADVRNETQTANKPAAQTVAPKRAVMSKPVMQRRTA